MENTGWLSRVTCWFIYPGSVFKTQQQLQRFSCSFKKIHWIIFGIFELNFPKNDQKCSMLWVMDGLCQMIMQTEGTGKKSPCGYTSIPAFSLTLKGTTLSVLVKYLTCVGYVSN